MNKKEKLIVKIEWMRKLLENPDEIVKINKEYAQKYPEVVSKELHTARENLKNREKIAGEESIIKE